jgi:hypothetical protein
MKVQASALPENSVVHHNRRLGRHDFSKLETRSKEFKCKPCSNYRDAQKTNEPNCRLVADRFGPKTQHLYHGSSGIKIHNMLSSHSENAWDGRRFELFSLVWRWDQRRGARPFDALAEGLALGVRLPLDAAAGALAMERDFAKTADGLEDAFAGRPARTSAATRSWFPHTTLLGALSSFR